MQTYLEEAALLEPVSGSLRRRGYRLQSEEVQFYDYSMDLYAYSPKSRATTAVELKLTRWKRAFEQALIYQLCADFVYLALPSSAASNVEVSLLARHGLGLISVRPGHCRVIVQPRQSAVVMSSYRQFYVKLVRENFK